MFRPIGESNRVREFTLEIWVDSASIYSGIRKPTFNKRVCPTISRFMENQRDLKINTYFEISIENAPFISNLKVEKGKNFQKNF